MSELFRYNFLFTFNIDADIVNPGTRNRSYFTFLLFVYLILIIFRLLIFSLLMFLILYWSFVLVSSVHMVRDLDVVRINITPIIRASVLSSHSETCRITSISTLLLRWHRHGNRCLRSRDKRLCLTVKQSRLHVVFGVLILLVVLLHYKIKL